MALHHILITAVLSWWVRKSGDRQVVTGVECCSSCGQRYKQVWLRLTAASAHRATLAGYIWASCIQALHYDVQLHTWSSSIVPDGFLSICFWHRITVTSSISQPITPHSTILQAVKKYKRTSSLYCSLQSWKIHSEP